jgi:hypothetical protein
MTACGWNRLCTTTVKLFLITIVVWWLLCQHIQYLSTVKSCNFPTKGITVRTETEKIFIQNPPWQGVQWDIKHRFLLWRTFWSSDIQILQKTKTLLNSKIYQFPCNKNTQTNKNQQCLTMNKICSMFLNISNSYNFSLMLQTFSCTALTHPLYMEFRHHQHPVNITDFLHKFQEHFKNYCQ